MRSKRGRKPPRLSLDAHIAIVGSGLSGLSTAITLERCGFNNIHIYERDASVGSRKEGYGLTLTYNPQGVLAQLGILEDLALEDCPSRSHYLFSSDGSVLGYFGNAMTKNGGWGQRGNLRVPRQKVRRILFSKLQTTKVHWGMNLVGYERIDTSQRGQINKLVFDTADSEGVVVEASLLVGADGIRSSVTSLVWPNAPPAGILGIRLILGITEGFVHPHVHERGFYTLGPATRLFVMPFAGKAWDEPDNTSDTRPERYMWQLSFAADSAQDLTPEELQAEALQRCNEWHQPVLGMIQSTPVSDIWGTMLYDRNPDELLKHISSVDNPPRVLVCGDACHGMSPFKGQGANQALTDGIHIGPQLLKSNIDAAIKVAQREICIRTAPVVQASRQAAGYWHSPLTFQEAEHAFAGAVDADRAVKALLDANINANTSTDLDADAFVVLRDRGLIDSNSRKRKNTVTDCESLYEKARKAAASGDTASLRRITWEHGADVLQESGCVNDAHRHGNQRCTHWLTVEAGCTISTS